jgi:hypothetical protein
MTRRKVIHWKSVFMGMASLALIFCAHVFLTLFALPITPVEYKAPPNFAREVVPPAATQPANTDEPELTSAAPAPGGLAGEDIEGLAKGVLLEGQSPDQFLALFSHPDQAVRMAAARALALCWSANMGMAEPRAEGHEELMRRYEFEHDFWANADKPVVLNALVDAVSMSFERGEGEPRADDYHVLYLLSGSWGQSAQRAEILAWVANHHPSDDMRLSAMFFLVNRGREFAREIGDEVLDSRASDPSFRVRFEAWKQRAQRIF